MKLVIDVPEVLYKAYKGMPPSLGDKGMDMIAQSIANGTPLPKGHGDLVDRDKVIDLLNEQEYNYYTELDKVCDTVCEAPIIIEADKEGEQK